MTIPVNLHQQSAADVGRAIAGGLDPVEVADVFLERIAKEADQPVFITITAARARQEALASRERHAEGQALGPLDGVPIAWKDLIDVEGSPTTAGSALRRDSEPVDKDAPIVANATAAGMVTLGKVNLTEFAYSGIGLNSQFGTPTIPHDATTPRAPGGSSSGSATAVSRGLAACAIGSDTGGSVRIPAAFNGLTGYKSSEGRISKEGVVPLSTTLDTIGPLAHTVEDCILLDAVLRGVTPILPAPTELSDIRLLVPENVMLDELDPAVAENFLASLDALGHAGIEIDRRRLPSLDEVVAMTRRHGTLIAAEAYAHYRDMLESEDAERVDRRVVARMMMGKSMTSEDVAAIREGRKRLADELRAELGDAFLAMPTCPHVAPEIAPLEADDELFHKTNLKTTRNTTIGNILGTPGVAMPNGADGSGLPTSLLISALADDDDRLLAAALTIEQVMATPPVTNLSS
jgi:aspartyl-tRNA(Asn)/glutamyl-tRNA(Gln) amidotransferase subunit A